MRSSEEPTDRASRVPRGRRADRLEHAKDEERGTKRERGRDTEGKKDDVGRKGRESWDGKESSSSSSSTTAKATINAAKLGHTSTAARSDPLENGSLPSLIPLLRFFFKESLFGLSIDLGILKSFSVFPL